MAQSQSSGGSSTRRAAMGRLSMHNDGPIANSFGAMFEADVPLFPLLKQMQRLAASHRHLVRAGIVIECVQTVAFAALPYHRWSRSLEGIFQAVLAVAFPIFDPDHIAAGYEITAAFMCAFLAGLLALFAFLIAGLIPSEEGPRLLPPRVVQTASDWGNAVSSWLLVPIVAVSASFFFCDPTEQHSAWYGTGVECMSGTGYALRIIAVVTTVLATCVAFFVRTMLFESSPSINVMTVHARAHAKLDVLLLSQRVGLVILWQYFQATGQLLYMAPLVAATSLAVCAAAVVMVPYFRLGTLHAVVFAQLLACTTAICAGISHSGEDELGRVDHHRAEWWTDNVQAYHIDTAVYLALVVPLTYLLSVPLHTWRLSAAFKSDFGLLKHEGKIRSATCQFPANLPDADEMGRHDYAGLLADLDAEATSAAKSMSADASTTINKSAAFEPDDDDLDEKLKKWHFSTPAVDTVVMNTDVELATRFLGAFASYTGLQPTANMLAFAARIFTRGRLRFGFDGTVGIAFTHFLLSTAKRIEFAHAELQRLRSCPLSLRARFESFKMNQQTESLLHLTRKAKGRQTSEKVKRHHREVLQAIADFWTLLSSEDCDTNSLAVATSAVIANREACATIYSRMLTHNPQNIEFVSLYAKFCDDVLNNADATQQTIQSLSEVLEMRATQATRGARAKLGGETTTPLPLSAAQESTVTSGSGMASRVANVRTQTFGFTGFVCLVALVVLLFALFYNDQRVDTIDATFTAGRLRAATASGLAAIQALPPAIESNNASLVESLQREAFAAAADVNHLRNALFNTDLRPSSARHFSFRESPVFYAAGTSTAIVSLWSSIGFAAEGLREAAANANLTRTREIVRLQESLATDVAVGLNRTVELYSADADHRDFIMAATCAALLVLAGVSMVVTFTQLVSSVHAVSRVKSEILALFGYIRRDRLSALLAQSKRRITEFDSFLSLDDKTKAEQLTAERSEVDLGGLGTQQQQQHHGALGGLRDDAVDMENASEGPTDGQETMAAANDHDAKAESGSRVTISGEEDDDHIFPNNAVQPLVNFIVLVASLVAMSLAIVTFFPTLTWAQRREYNRGLLTAETAIVRGLNEDVLEIQRAIATGNWKRQTSSSDGRHEEGDNVAASLKISGHAQDLHRVLVETTSAPAHAQRTALVVRRKLRAAERLLRIATAFAKSVPLAPGFAETSVAPESIVKWARGRVDEELAWSRDPAVIDPAERWMPYRRLPVLLGLDGGDLTTRNATERLRIAIDIGFSDLVHGLVRSATADARLAAQLTRQALRDTDRGTQQFLLGGILVVLIAFAVPGCVLLLRREYLVAPKVRITRAVAFLVSAGLIGTIAGAAVAAALLAIDLDSRATPEAVDRSSQAQREYDGTLYAVQSAALSLVVRDADPVWAARMKSLTGNVESESHLVYPRTALVSAGITDADIVDHTSPPHTYDAASLLDALRASTRLALATLRPTQTILNTSDTDGAFRDWNFARNPRAVSAWTRTYGPQQFNATHGAITVRYDPSALFASPASTTVDLDAIIAAEGTDNERPAGLVVRAAAAATAIAAPNPRPPVGSWPSLRDSFDLSRPRPEPLVAAQHQVGQYVDEARDLAAPLSTRVRITLSCITNTMLQSSVQSLVARFDTRLGIWTARSSAAEEETVALSSDLKISLVGMNVFAATAMLAALFVSVVRTSVDAEGGDDEVAEADATNSGTSSGGAAEDDTATQATSGRQKRRSGKLESREGSSFMQAVEPAIMTVVVLIVLACCGLFVFLDFRASQPTASMVAAATGREYVVAAAVAEARVLQDATVAATGGAGTARDRLSRLAAEGVSGLQRLYFFARDMRIVGLGRDSVQDDLLYGVTTEQQAIDQYVSLSSASSSSYFLGIASNDTTKGGEEVALGIVAAYDVFFLAEIRALVAARIPDDVQKHAANVIRLAPPLLRALERSSELYRTGAGDVRREGSLNIAIFAAAVIMVTLLYCCVVMVRFVNGMQAVEASARTMVELIPPGIVEATPAIQAYLESGAGDGGEDAAASNEAQISDAIGHMSTLPVIAIDVKGKIIKFTQAAERAFGYTSAEVTGLNIKILMPPDIQEHHDGYLSRYERTGQKHIIDTTRRTRAMRKNGEVFPVDVSVKEIEVARNENVYVGFVRDNSTAVQLSLQGVLNRYILQMSDAAIIAIDDRGTILLASQRVTDLFGFESHEMLRENVRMLMPSDIAMQHDGYLARYRETGVQHIIGRKNVLTAQRKNGEVFRIAITVREIKSEEYGESSTFVATITDVTKEEEQQAMLMIHDLISDLSPTPIIAITDDGTIVKFSRAASKLFGYPPEEVVAERMNIQALVPDTYGDHTHFMQSYRQRPVNDARKNVVVGKTRNILARKRNGAEFPIEITLREVSHEGVAPIFLSFVTDATEKAEGVTTTAVSDAAVDQSLIPLIAISTNGTVTRFNQAAVECFGYKATEVLGKNIKMLMPKRIAENHDSYLERYLRTRQRTVVDRTRHVLGRRKDGHRVPLELNVREVAATETTGASYIGYARDITVERHARRQYFINDLVSELSTVPILSIDHVGTVQSFSRAAEEVFGYHAMEVIGQNIKMLTPRDIAAKHDGYLSNFHETGVKRVIDTTRRLYGIRKDGKPVPLELSVREIKDPNGGKSSFVGFARDTSDDGALDAATELGQVIRDVSIVPLMEMNPDGTILHVNDAFLKEFRFTSKDQVIGENVTIVATEGLTPKIHDRYVQSHLQGRGKGIVNSTRRVPARRFDGTLLTVELALSEFRSEETGRHFFVSYLQNVEDQIELEQANSTVNAITNMSSTPIIAMDGAGTVITFNEAATMAFGYDADEVRGQNVKMLMPKEIADKHDGYLRTYAKTGLRNVIDQVVRQQGRRKDGRLFPLELRVKELNPAATASGDGGSESGKNDAPAAAVNTNASSKLFVGYARDVTADLELERESNIFGIVLSLSSTPILVINRVGKVQSINRAGLELFQYEEEDVVGKNIKMLMPKRIAVHHDRFLKAYIATGEKRVIDSTRRVEAKKKDGAEFACEISVREVVPTSGNEEETVYAGFLRDLTEEIRVERRTLINRAVSDLSLYPLIVMTGEGVIQGYSSSAASCFGFSFDEVVGKNIKMLMPEETANKHDGYLAAFRGRADMANVNVKRTVRARRKDGQEFLCRIYVRALSVNDGVKATDDVMLVGYLEDITDRETYERDVRITAMAISRASVPVIEMELDGTIKTFNTAAENQFEWAAKDVVGNNIKMLMPEYIAVNHDGYLKRYLETGVKSVIGTRRSIPAMRKGGREFPAIISVFEINTAASHHYIGYVEDQTQFMALAEARAINTAALVGSNDPFVTMDENGTVIDGNPAVEKLFGWAVDDLRGQNVKVLVAEPHKSRHDGYLARYRETGKATVLNTTTRGLKAERKDGSTTTVDLQVREVQLQGQRVFIGSFRETTRLLRKELDRAVAVVAEKGCLRPIIAMDDVGTILRMNEAAVLIFGYTNPDELLGKNIKVLQPREVADKHDWYLRRYKQTGEKHVIDTMRQVTGKKKNGSMVEIRLEVKEVTVDTAADNAEIDFSLMLGDATAKDIGTQTLFVAILEDVAQSNMMQLGGVLNDAVMQLLPSPVVTIDERGTVLSFNAAAEAAFEFTAKQVNGRNVNILMPHEVAVKHDGFLKRYSDTGVKHVIDSSRNVVGETKSGEPVYITLQVREVRRPRQNKGTGSLPGGSGGTNTNVAARRADADDADDDRMESIFVGFMKVHSRKQPGM